MAGIIAKSARQCPTCGAETRLLRLVRTAPACTGQRCLSCGWEAEPQYTLDASGQAVEVSRVGGMVVAR